MTREEYFRQTKFILNLSYQMCDKLGVGDRILVGSGMNRSYNLGHPPLQVLYYHAKNSRTEKTENFKGFMDFMKSRGIFIAFKVTKLHTPKKRKSWLKDVI